MLHIPPTQGCLALLEPGIATNGCPSATRRMGLNKELLKEHGKFFGANFLRRESVQRAPMLLLQERLPSKV